MKDYWYAFLLWLLPGYTTYVLELTAEALQEEAVKEYSGKISCELTDDNADRLFANIETAIRQTEQEFILQKNPEPGEDVDAFEAAAKKRVMEIFWECKKKGMVEKDELVNSGFDFVVRKLNYDGSFNIFGRTVFTPVPIFAKTLNEGVEIGYHPGHAKIYFAIMDGYAYVTNYVPEKGGELWKG